MPRTSKPKAQSSAAERRTSKRIATGLSSISKPSSPTIKVDIEKSFFKDRDCNQSDMRSHGFELDTSLSKAQVHGMVHNPETPAERLPWSIEEDSSRNDIPKFHALEAVNDICKKLRTAEIAITRSQVKNDALTKELAASRQLEREIIRQLNIEQEKVKELESKLEERSVDQHKYRLERIVGALRSFGGAAQDLIPLLQCLAGESVGEENESAKILIQELKEQMI